MQTLADPTESIVDHVSETPSVEETRSSNTHMDDLLRLAMESTHTFLWKMNLEICHMHGKDKWFSIFKEQTEAAEKALTPLVFAEVEISSKTIVAAIRHLKIADAAADELRKSQKDPWTKVAIIQVKEANQRFETIFRIVVQIENLAQS